MAYYQILFWQDIPSQIKAWDDFDEIKVEMPAKFMVKIDSTAKAQGLMDEDNYLAQWNWGKEEKREGSAEEVAESIKNELESKFSY
ncbi:MAG: virulence factor [Ignavibacteriaceae bacterium]